MTNIPKNREEIFQILVKTLHEMFEIPMEKLTPDANLFEDLDIDSIDAVDLMVKLSQMTGKRLKPETFKTIRTIDDVVNALVPLILENQS